MPKYMLAIQKQIPDYPEITIEFEEKTKKEAIVRSNEIVKEMAERYSNGLYKTKLFKKHFVFGWCRVSTPEIVYTNNL